MRIIITSDSHKNAKNLAFLAQKNISCNRFIFLGDGENDIKSVANKIPQLPITALRGNTDIGSDLENECKLNLGGKLIFAAHGHTYGVKGGLGRFISAAKRAGADIALFGHTHIPLIKNIGGLIILNPGTISGARTGRCTFDVIETDQNGNVVPFIHTIKQGEWQ